tara:strand:- start:106 stop:549 length:444 start_codon:yes stop_codon:yes gene_type:complete
LNIGVILGFLYANFLDWGVHILLHKPRGNSKFKFHWKHHKIARKNGNHDPDYKIKLWQNETKIGVAAMILHSPLLLLFPVFTITVLIYASIYLVLHRKSHQHVKFFKKWLPWHYEHHMGRNQNANWCVICPLMDHIMGTREKWLDKD